MVNNSNRIHSNVLLSDLFRYNANLDDPYPRSPDKKRFITEGNITAQQCRSWFANRRQRLKHVKKNLSKTTTTTTPSPSPSSSSSSRLQQSLQTR